MNITDLMYLDDVSQAFDLTGGRGRRLSPALSVQSNTAIVRQNARSNSKAFAFYGDATAVSVSTNNSDIGQGNFQF